MRIFALIVLFIATNTLSAGKLKNGVYRAVIILREDEKVEVPFNFEVKTKGKKQVIIIRNADERIVVDELSLKGDSVNFFMPVFDTEFRTKRIGDTLQGLWINHYKTNGNKLKFKAVLGEQKRFLFNAGKPNPLFEGKWEVAFSPGTKDESKAIGVFHHVEQTDYVTGTFLTETGDYRYLEGMRDGNRLHLSCFDGSHAYYFTADLNADKELKGKFYSGASWLENWTGKPNESYQLTNADSITRVVNKEAKIDFTFPDLNGKMVSLNDAAYKNKAVIIQVMGSWCPNCMDESAYLAQVYKANRAAGLEIIALAFEKTSDLARSQKLLTRLKLRFGMEYEILITGQSGREKASAMLPALSGITAFPTTIFLNRQHQVAKIHTGFSGPATGIEYELFKEKTEAFIKKLLSE